MSKITMQQEGSNPASPASSKWITFFKSDGLYIKDSAGNVTGPVVSNAVAKTYLDTLYPPQNGWIPGTGTWSYSSADAPTFVISINADVTAIMGVGNRIKLTQTTAKYFIVTAVGNYSGGATLVTVYGGTDYTLANAAITNPYYSVAKAPFGFPVDPTKWTVTYTNSSVQTQSTPVASTWYNAGSQSITVPIGSWTLSYQCAVTAVGNSAQTFTNVFATLSTANNTESETAMTGFAGSGGASGTYSANGSFTRLKLYTIAAKTVLYMNISTSASCASININSGSKTLTIMAVCAYL